MRQPGRKRPATLETPLTRTRVLRVRRDSPDNPAIRAVTSFQTQDDSSLTSHLIHFEDGPPVGTLNDWMAALCQRSQGDWVQTAERWEDGFGWMLTDVRRVRVEPIA